MIKRLLNNKNFRNIFLYGLIGGFAAVIDFSVFTFCVKLLLMHSVVANIISMHIGMLVSFSFNTFFNFKKADKLIRRFFSYYGVVLIGMLISSFIIGFASLFMPVLIVKVIAMVIVSVIQYLLNRLVTYKF